MINEAIYTISVHVAYNRYFLHKQARLAGNGHHEHTRACVIKTLRNLTAASVIDVSRSSSRKLTDEQINNTVDYTSELYKVFIFLCTV